MIGGSPALIDDYPAIFKTSPAIIGGSPALIDGYSAIFKTYPAIINGGPAITKTNGVIAVRSSASFKRPVQEVSGVSLR